MGLCPEKGVSLAGLLFSVLDCTQANLSSSVSQSVLFLDEVQR